MKRLRHLFQPSEGIETSLVASYSDVNTFGLPVEIWQDIFKLVIIPIAEHFDIDHELESSISPLSTLSWGPNSIMNACSQEPHPAVFSTRRTIVLVCRSWYHIGIATLHSHIFINFDAPLAKMTALRHALDHNPNFAQSVVRLSLITKRYSMYLLPPPYDGTDESSNTAQESEGDREGRLLFNAIVAHLSNLKILVCPTKLAHWMSMPRYPELCILYWPGCWLGKFDIISKNAYFWRFATTLLLVMENNPWNAHFQHENETPATLFFPNLINLKLKILNPISVQWITDYWSTPNLRHLFISSVSCLPWLPFLSKHTSSLEHLELINGYGKRYSPVDHPIVTIPNLKSLCLGPGLNFYPSDPVQDLIDHLNAPNLDRFAITLRPACFTIHSVPHMKEKINAALHVYPKVEKIGLYYQTNVSRIAVWDEIEKAATEWTNRGLAVDKRQVRWEKGSPPDLA